MFYVKKMWDKFKSLFVRVRQSKDGRVLGENLFYITLMEIARYIFPLITIPYLARVLGVVGVGKVAFAAAVMMWVNTIINWGFNSSAVRDLAQNRDDKVFVSKHFSVVLWSRMLLMVLTTVVLVILTFVIPKFRDIADLLMASFIAIPANIIASTWFFRGMEKMKYNTILSVIAQAVFTILVFVFVRDEDDYVLQPLLGSLGSVVCAVISVAIIKKEFDVKLHRPDFKQMFVQIKGSTDIFINELMPNFYNNFSALLLGFYGDAAANGIYDAGKKLCNIFNTIHGAAISTFFPYFSRKTHRHSQFAKINIVVSVFVSLLIFIFAPLLIHLFYGDKFMGAVLVARITAFALVGITLNYVYGTNYLIVIHREHLLRNITIVVSLIGFGVAFLLIPQLGVVGAACTYTISSLLIGVVPMIVSLYIKKNEKNIENCK